jgi:ABC-type glutathione transport system ATPase component
VTEPLISARHLDVSVGSARILRDVSLDIAPGETVALIGESGSGKSMFARTILGLLPRDTTTGGTLSFAGAPLLGRPDSFMRTLRGSRIGYVPQDPGAAFNPMLRVARQIAEPAHFHPERAAEVGALSPVEMLRRVNLSEPERRARQYPHEMSGGMLQRALIAAAVSLGPSLLIADEPTTGLDVTTQAGIVTLLREVQVQSGTSVLMISHDLALVSMMCQRIIVLFRGEVVEQGTTAAVVGNPQHEYTRALLAATPTLERRGAA